MKLLISHFSLSLVSHNHTKRKRTTRYFLISRLWRNQMQIFLFFFIVSRYAHFFYTKSVRYFLVSPGLFSREGKEVDNVFLTKNRNTKHFCLTQNAPFKKNKHLPIVRVPLNKRLVVFGTRYGKSLNWNKAGRRVVFLMESSCMFDSRLEPPLHLPRWWCR